MTLQSLVVVALRLIALDILVEGAVQSVSQTLLYAGTHARALAEAQDWFIMILPLLFVVGLFVCAYLLWVLALPIARLVTRGVAQEISFGALALADCYSIAFITVGLSYVASHLPRVLDWSHFLLKAAATDPGDSWKEGVDWYAVSLAFVPFIAGVVLLLKGRQWAMVLGGQGGAAESPNSAEPISQKRDGSS